MRGHSPQLAQTIHQIATPLTNAWWDVEQLLSKSKRHRRQLQAVLAQLKVVLTAIQQRDSKEIGQVNFSPEVVIKKILTDYHKPYGVCCYFQAGNKKLQMHGCPDLFAEIVINLINNAAEAYEHNHAEREVVIELMPAMQGITLVVGDHGQGMKWWQKTMASWGGVSFKKIKSGLGLHRVQRLLHEQFDGKLELISRPGRGTLAVVYVPL
jgi:signal transduction histidine kinase